VSNERHYHRIADELESGWLESWASDGIIQIEAYLAKHAAFIAFLEDEV
jgi:hypothetical protein